MSLQIKLLREASRAPSRAHTTDAGLDLHYIGDKAIIKEGDKLKIATGFAMIIPGNYCAKVYPRSGMGTKQQFVLANVVGIIDSTYRGEVFVTLVNSGSAPVILNTGDKFAQMLIEPVMHWSPEIVLELPSTERGTGGFGSTGK